MVQRREEFDKIFLGILTPHCVYNILLNGRVAHKTWRSQMVKRNYMQVKCKLNVILLVGRTCQ